VTAPFDTNELALLAARLVAGRGAILRRWHAAVAADPAISAADSLSRRQFVDHIPAVLQAIHDTIIGSGRAAPPSEPAQSHGLHRWQQGYALIEVVREWQLLHQAVLQEIDDALHEAGGFDAATVSAAHRAVTGLCLEAMYGSVAEYERLRRAEAHGQLQDIDRGLRQTRELERRQAELLREVAHDLRGGMGIVSTATAALRFDRLPQERRVDLLAMVDRAIAGQTRLLTDLLDLARLQAGLERRALQAVDASAVLRDLCSAAQPIAAARGLRLQWSGPESLVVQTDPVKLHRVVQNLVLNALRYTAVGNVEVSWGDSTPDDPARWRVDVTDTGPGIAASPLTHAIVEATHEARSAGDTSSDIVATGGPGYDLSDNRREGVGLAIVKRLCEVLDATLAMDTAAGRGTAVRIVLPRRYGVADPPVQ
jgi:signal transduction histidine kinase